MNSHPTFLIFTSSLTSERKYVKPENLALPIFEVFALILLDVNISLNHAPLISLFYTRQTRMTQLILVISL